MFIAILDVLVILVKLSGDKHIFSGICLEGRPVLQEKRPIVVCFLSAGAQGVQVGS